jgi:hypothetical protein
MKRIHKTFDSEIIPRVGDLIEDSVWKDPYEYKVSEVTINYQNDTCYVFLEKQILETDKKEHLSTHLKMTKLHDWENS